VKKGQEQGRRRGVKEEEGRGWGRREEGGEGERNCAVRRRDRSNESLRKVVERGCSRRASGGGKVGVEGVRETEG